LASISLKYLAKGTGRDEASRKRETCGVHALFYAAETDLLPLLLATKYKMDRIAVLHLEEANA